MLKLGGNRDFQEKNLWSPWSTKATGMRFIATPCTAILSSLYGETRPYKLPGGNSAVVIDRGDEFTATAAQDHIAGMAQISRALVALHLQSDRSRLILASERLGSIGGDFIDHHRLEVPIIQLLDGRASEVFGSSCRFLVPMKIHTNGAMSSMSWMI